jgi:uncharacterized protein (TIGR02145 family)
MKKINFLLYALYAQYFFLLLTLVAFVKMLPFLLSLMLSGSSLPIPFSLGLGWNESDFYSALVFLGISSTMQSLLMLAYSVLLILSYKSLYSDYKNNDMESLFQKMKRVKFGFIPFWAINITLLTFLCISNDLLDSIIWRYASLDYLRKCSDFIKEYLFGAIAMLYIYLVLASGFSLAYLKLLRKNGVISKKQCVMHSILQLLFIADIFDTMALAKFNPMKKPVICLFIALLFIACDSKPEMQFTDHRDGKAYKIVKIGEQTWMAENLNYKAGRSWCYDYDKANCKKYGRLYDWETAIKACPAGWHLPDTAEWEILFKIAGGKEVAGKKLKSSVGSDGTDDFGFSATHGGSNVNNSFLYIDRNGKWWSATEFSGDNAYNWNMYNYGSSPDGVRDDDTEKSEGLSVRCVQDAGGAAATVATPQAAAMQAVVSNSSFIDSRNGRKYNAVKINEQTWMAENLNYETGTSWCYDDKKSNCEKYGRLYGWETAKSVCPSGWHLPSNAEWEKLVESTNEEVTMLKSKNGWAATPGGSCHYGGFFDCDYIGKRGDWWSSTENSKYSCARHWYIPNNYIYDSCSDKDHYAYSVRCVQDVAIAQPSVKRSFFTDSRDGQKYGAVKIGNKTWMAENLKYKIDTSWCYDRNESNCEKYGRLYNWGTAKGACPSGWHLPSRDEWNDLALAAGGARMNLSNDFYDYNIAGNKLKSKTGWKDYRDDIGSGNGTDELGFSAMPGGMKGDPFFEADSSYGLWWTAAESGSGSAYYRYIYNYDAVVMEYRGSKEFSYSVRCVLDL